MISWTTTGRSVLLSGVATCMLGCGEPEKKTLFEPLQGPGEVMDVQPLTTPTVPVDVPPAIPPTMPPTDVTEGTGTTLPGLIGTDTGNTGDGGDDNRCKPALGVSGSPTTIPEALVLLNTLPKPTSLACFLQALDRPLTLYMTESNQSLQPSPGPRSPRTFVLRGDLEMSIVFEGMASNTLEFGFRPTPARSIKAEIAFPITKDVNEFSLFDRIREGRPRGTICGDCHVAEEHIMDYPSFPAGVFESDIFEPFLIYEVQLDALKAEAASCDESAEPYRCELLSALFDHGETVQGLLRGRE